jgi:hypothetical protein
MVNFTQEAEEMYQGQMNTPFDKILKAKEIPVENRIVNLDRPKYYGGAGNTYEVFNVLEAWGLDKDFYLGNVMKYLARAGKKTSNKKEDLQKALVYLQRRIDKL